MRRLPAVTARVSRRVPGSRSGNGANTAAAASVPLFTARLTENGRDDAKRFAEEVFAVLVLTLVVLCTAIQIAMPWAMHVFAPGFVGDPERFDLTVELTRITFPYLLFISLVSQLGGILNSLGRFAAAAVAQHFIAIAHPLHGNVEQRVRMHLRGAADGVPGAVGHERDAALRKLDRLLAFDFKHAMARRHDVKHHATREGRQLDAPGRGQLRAAVEAAADYKFLPLIRLPLIRLPLTRAAAASDPRSTGLRRSRRRRGPTRRFVAHWHRS